MLVQSRGLIRPGDQRKEQEDFRSSMNRRTAEDPFPAHELDDPSEQNKAFEEHANLKTLDLDAFMGRIEILGNDDVHQFSSVQSRITRFGQKFSSSTNIIGSMPRS